MHYAQIVADALTYAITGAEKVVVPGGGHALNWEQPELFVAEILKFLGAAEVGLGRATQSCRASANAAFSGITSGGKPEAASIRPLKLKKDASAVISQIALSFHPHSRNNSISSSPTKLGVSVSLLA